MKKELQKQLPFDFPEIKENEVLYIIGNGFDVAHGLETQPFNFKNWCNRLNKNIYVFDSLFSTQLDFWEKMEEALGDYNEEAILDFCKPDEEFDYDHSLSSSARIEDAPMSILEPALDNLKDYFAEWVNSLTLDGVEDFLKLHKNAKYLTFNYTETLEKIYKIPSENICHIHGSRLQESTEYVFGHINYINTNSYCNTEIPVYEEMAYLSIFNCMNNFIKPIDKIIKANNKFFEQLQKIKLIYTLGHSLSEIDMPYFDYLLSTFIEQPTFYFSSYNKDDDEKIRKFIETRKIIHYKMIEINDLVKL